MYFLLFIVYCNLRSIISLLLLSSMSIDHWFLPMLLMEFAITLLSHLCASVAEGGWTQNRIWTKPCSHALPIHVSQLCGCSVEATSTLLKQLYSQSSECAIKHLTHSAKLYFIIFLSVTYNISSCVDNIWWIYVNKESFYYDICMI